MRLRTLLLPVFVAASVSPALAANGDSVQASGDSVEASAQVAAELAGASIPVAMGSAVIIAGSGAAIATGNFGYAERGFDVGGAIIDLPRDENGGFVVSDTVIVADPPPDVPFDAPSQPDKGED
ncbi:hypothetical protein [Hyphobacterium sp.]|uniref:hypothetical protein n=1 Tax=Hyphobacterium sp. TaxID=2004662 RepID=UPI003749417F